MSMKSFRILTFGVVWLVAGAAGLRGQPRAMFVPDREIPARLPINGATPIWRGGALLGVEKSDAKAPVLYLVDRGGRREEFLFSIPESSWIGISGIALAEDGTIGLCGGATTAEAIGTRFIAIISPDHKRQTLIRTWPYQAQQIALAPDGTIWTAGVITDDANTRVVVYNVLRRYERSGKLLASWSVRAKARAQMGPNAVDSSHPYLMASRDRVGWLSNGGEYFEYSLDGREIGQYAPPAGVVFGWPGANDTFNHPDLSERSAPHVLDAALSQNNDLLLCAFKGDNSRTWQLLRLDRESRTWVPATAEQKGWPSVAGFDGDDPVLLPGVGELGRIQHLRPVTHSAQ
jgi:hypothetical protein